MPLVNPTAPGPRPSLPAQLRWPGHLCWPKEPLDLLFYALLILHVVPIWAFHYFLTQDGPNHLYCANLLRLYHQPAGELFRQYYTVNPEPNPNWLGYLLMAGLSGLTGPLVAEKLLLTLYLLLLPLGLRWLLGTIRPGAGGMAVLVFPFLHNWPFHMGFYNYLLSLALLPVTLGYWARHEGAPRPRHALALAGLLALLYAGHLTSLVLTLAAILTLCGWFWLLERGAAEGERAGFWRRQRARWLFTLGAFAPVLLFAGYFLWTHPSQPEPPRPYTGVPDYGLWKTVPFAYLYDAMVSYHPSEVMLAKMLGLGLLATALTAFIWRWRGRRQGRWDGLALVAVVWYLAYHFAPGSAAGGTFLYHRLGLCPYLALAAWLGAVELPRRMQLGLVTFTTCVAVGFLGFYTARYAEADALMREYAEAGRVIRPHSVILPLCLSPQGERPNGDPLAFNTSPFIHAGCYVALARDGVNLCDSASLTAHGPTRFRPAVDPLVHLGRSEVHNGLAAMRFDDYARRTGGRIDNVLVWDNGHDQLLEPEFAGLRRQLEEGYRLIYTSRPGGRMRVYAPKAAGVAAAPPQP